jgi:hypothetical protein
MREDGRSIELGFAARIAVLAIGGKPRDQEVRYATIADGRAPDIVRDGDRS